MIKSFLTVLIALVPIGTARTFETFTSKPTSSMRLPASVLKEALEIDCSTSNKNIELSTPLETIRIVGKDCPHDISLMQMEFKQKLHTFPAVEEGSISSEFAYLKKGENVFEVLAGSKTIQLKVFRY
jgi:hypothetical protein